MGNLASELSDVHEGFRARLASVFTAWRERLTRRAPRGPGAGRGRGGLPARRRSRHFLVAALEGAILLSKVTKDIAVMEQCVTS